MGNATDLATLLSTRLCHDLTGPISAVNNGVELLEEMGDSPEMQQEAMALILSSAKEAARRLQFYRLAFGHLSSSEDASLLSRSGVVDGFFEATKTQVQWPEQMAPMSQQMIRLVFNLFIAASQSLIKGGKIVVSEHGAGGVKLHASGEAVRMNPQYIEVLNGDLPIGAADPKTIQLQLIRSLLSEIGAVLAVTLETDVQFILSLSAPAPHKE